LADTLQAGECQIQPFTDGPLVHNDEFRKERCGEWNMRKHAGKSSREVLEAVGLNNAEPGVLRHDTAIPEIV
jgi:hypothetical protein